MAMARILAVGIFGVAAVSLVIAEIRLTPVERAEREARLRERDAAAAKAKRQKEIERISPLGLARAIYEGKSGASVSVSRQGSAVVLEVSSDSYWSLDVLRGGALMDAKDYLPKVFAAHSDVEIVQVVHRAKLGDVRGNAEMADVLRISMRRRTAESINWQNFHEENFPRVADAYWEHRALRGAY